MRVFLEWHEPTRISVSLSGAHAHACVHDYCDLMYAREESP